MSISVIRNWKNNIAYSEDYNILNTFSHEAPNDPEDPLSNQNIKDRFYGMNDPVADKLVKRYQETAKEEKIKAG